MLASDIVMGGCSCASGLYTASCRERFASLSWRISMVSSLVGKATSYNLMRLTPGELRNIDRVIRFRGILGPAVLKLIHDLGSLNLQMFRG